MPGPAELLAEVRAPTALSALLLIVLVPLVIKLGRILLLAAIFGAVAGAATLSQGNPPKLAALHAAIGFGGSALMFFLLKLAKQVLIWIAITVAGVAALLAFGFRR